VAVTAVNLRKVGRNASHTNTGKRYVETYIAKSSAASDNEDLVFDNVAVPSLGDPYPTDSDASCTDVTVIAVPEANNKWEITVTYEENYLSRTRYDWVLTPIREALTVDADNNPIVNSRGDAYYPAIERDIYIPTVRVTRSEYALAAGGTFDYATAFGYVGTVNDGPVDINGYQAEAGEALLKDIQIADDNLQGNGSYWEVTYTVMFKPNNTEFNSTSPANSSTNAWFAILLDAGLTYNDNTTGEAVAFRNEGDGAPVKQPRLLDGNGGLPSETTGAIYRAFRIYKTSGWGLGLAL